MKSRKVVFKFDERSYTRYSPKDMQDKFLKAEIKNPKTGEIRTMFIPRNVTLPSV